MLERITDDCIAVANEMFMQLPEWAVADETLAKAKRAFPSDSFGDVLAKAVLINELYSTSVWAIKPMASHMSDLLAAHPKTPELVDLVAHLPATRRTNRSFASKYFHFFVSPEFHILDDAACVLLHRHTGFALKAIKERSYAQYHRLVEWVLDQHGRPSWGPAWIGTCGLRVCPFAMMKVCRSTARFGRCLRRRQTLPFWLG